MLLKLFQNFFAEKSVTQDTKNILREQQIADAIDLYTHGRAHEALEILKRFTEEDPTHVVALTTMGACYADMGNLQEAVRLFELAYALDDSFLPAVVNNAKMLADRRQSREALPFLRHARAMEADFAPIDNVYAAICHTLGKTKEARHFHLRAWLSNFDNLRIANGYLFHVSYDDITERHLAAEHRFWAETVRSCNLSLKNFEAPKARKKIRIGYWSPDFRGHSVRFFFRPLLENHDNSRFETYLYHDTFSRDKQTDLIEARCDAFHDVHCLSDQQLCELIRSHQLDVLVELAGHTSANRIFLLQERLATLQITGLGYPPTTGLASIDAKVLDQHLITEEHARYYAEMPIVLPSSFWCFDPMEETPAFLAPEPPVVRNRYITFGCIGNVAKINERILACWREILRRVPRSRLLIRSISFEDPAAEEAVREQYRASGLPMERVDLRKPEGGKAYFESYNDIDIILDTTPFNGGTTTCFAVYMGVPVITWAGSSLISRMGLSIMTNVGAADLVVTSADAYVRRAVALSQDMKYLQCFKKEARERMRKTGLGNGKIFAREFEQVCAELLEKRRTGSLGYQHQIDVLPADEIVRRAYGVMRRDQPEAAQRILRHCLHHYPNCGSAHILLTQPLTEKNHFSEAADYLLQRLDHFSEAEQIAALVNVVRCQLLAGRSEQVAETLVRLGGYHPESLFDQCQIALCQAVFRDGDTVRDSVNLPLAGRMHCVIPCDEMARFEAIRHQMEQTCRPLSGWQVTFERCPEIGRIQCYRQAAQSPDIDVLVLIQKNIDVCHPNFFQQVVGALQSSNLVGFAGATVWNRLDWNSAPLEQKAGGFIIPSQEKTDFFELQILGVDRSLQRTDIAVLDGCFLAADRTALALAPFNEDWVNAEALLEQAWSHAVYRAGGRLSVHRNLGVLLQTGIRLGASDWAAVRGEIAEQHGFDVLEMCEEDYSMLSFPVISVQAACTAMSNYCLD